MLLGLLEHGPENEDTMNLTFLGICYIYYVEVNIIHRRLNLSMCLKDIQHFKIEK